MKRKLLFGTLLVAAISFGFTSCGDDDDVDTEKPTISDFEPAEGDELKIGSAIHFEVDFADNVALASYKVDIHGNFDNHSHASTKATTDSVVFSFNRIWTTIAGQRNAHVHHEEIEIPAVDAATGLPYREGAYHFVIYCLDQAGNETVSSHNVTLSYSAEEHEH